MTVVKVCGITNLEDAQIAVECGADMLGFIFAHSPRRVSPKEVVKVVNALPDGVVTVGVFVNERPEQVERIVRTCGLDYAQLHGNETEDDIRRLSVLSIKAFRVADRSVLEEIAVFRTDIFLLDSFDPPARGGAGRRFDWSIAAEAAELGKMMLAGGLTPTNVAEAIRTVNP